MELATTEKMREVLGHPGVLPWVAPEGWSPAEFDAGDSVCLDLGRGYISFVKWSEDYWAIHIAMLPKSPPVAADGMRALAWMESEYGAAGFVANIPAVNLAARRLARICGFDECGRVPGGVKIGRVRSDVVIYVRQACRKL